MNDDITDVQYLRFKLAAALERARAMPDDVWELDGLRLAGMVMRLDNLRDTLTEAWSTMHLLYEATLERDRNLSEDRTVGGAPDGRSGVVADILGAATAGVRPDGSAVDHVSRRTETLA